MKTKIILLTLIAVLVTTGVGCGGRAATTARAVDNWAGDSIVRHFLITVGVAIAVATSPSIAVVNAP